MRAESDSSFLGARDLLLAARGDLEHARSNFRWPRPERFNWVRDYFDVIASQTDWPALRIVDDGGADLALSFGQMVTRSTQVATFLDDSGVRRGDRVLIMLGNVVPLWESMLAIIRLGAVMIPATTLLDGEDLRDRIERGRVKAIITQSELAPRFAQFESVEVRVAVGPRIPGWLSYDLSGSAHQKRATADTHADEMLLLYFTSGTTAKPKLVSHTHSSYPIGHLSTMYWLGLRPGDVHLNLSSPGWAKHAWSCFFAPWNAQSTILAYQYERFDAAALLNILVRCRVTTFCAPPTVWRMLVQQKLSDWKPSLREVVSAGEPLNPEVIAMVEDAWGLTIRDGFGQTETTAQIGNPPGQRIKPGSMGRELPGYRIELLDANGRPDREGEICIDLAERPVGLMPGYLDDVARNAEVMADGFYHTGDVATRDDDGYITYVGRADDVFKSSDYRISPFELESVLIEHPAVAEAAVVPCPDATRLHIPKAYVSLAAGWAADAETARSIFLHVRETVSAFKRIRRIEFGTLPKTISGKIRRVDLRNAEKARACLGRRGEMEYGEEDFPELRTLR